MVYYLNMKKTTLDDLARMTQNGFSSIKNDMDGQFTGVNKRFDEIDSRLNRIENILIRTHENRIEKLEDTMRIVLTRLEKTSNK